ncbi:putative monoacyl phosphatidylinositol tetramannoside-binding protein LpqW precursor [Corynebacterium ciconiae DSM 44920]|uniref:ABC transporter family substrate-binding protein n=1 Tax=Corynebacterium ciconiae TaxID=227319 RepID=UPI0012EA5754|nr:ABC transporter family substrate-binding protein [Corynebacterium ciconiae]WKD60856.1 putative monoacyl phosphatidylinositol tetramannoside-binding protein LpqW precursor [Corynebacterium ciconiae DSM 44920]
MARRGVLSCASAAIALCVASCVANPGPPPVEDVERATTASETSTQPDAPEENDPAERNQITVGMDPLLNGFNPHLIADATPFVESMAALVLPSAFVDGEINSSLLTKAEEIEPEGDAVQTVRYQISTAAQWSDGTPITGSDFQYLWESIVSTPGTNATAGYEQISGIRISNGGKTVAVDFSHRLEQWQELFTHLLPSHIFLTGTDGFDRVLANTMPVSGGRYQVSSIDRQRGEVVLSRNDRYWGTQPATIERLVFREIRSAGSAAEMMRRSQMDLADLSLEETTEPALDLVPGVDTATRVYPRRLDVVFNTAAPALDTPAKRAGFIGLIDAKLVASLATGRSTHLGLADPSEFPQPEVEPEALPENTEVTLGVDAADDEAVTAARSISDLAAQRGIVVNVVLTTTTELFSTLMPQGRIDGIVSRSRTENAPIEVATRYMCQVAVSQLCDEELDSTLRGYLGGSVDSATAQQAVQAVENREIITYPISYTIRLDAAGSRITGPAAEFADWPIDPYAGRLASAASWSVRDGLGPSRISTIEGD